MTSSVKSTVDAVRLAAVEEFGLALPLAKARNAISLLLYGKPYSSAIAAEKAGASLVPKPNVDSAAPVAHKYGVDVALLWDAAMAALDLETTEIDDDDETGYDDVDVFGGLCTVIGGVERAIANGSAAWASFLDNDDLLDQFGTDALLDLNEASDEFHDILDNAISSDGRSLMRDLDRLAKRLPLGAFDPMWLEALRHRTEALSAVPPKPRRLNRSAMVLMVAPDLSAFADSSLPWVNYDRVDFARLADVLAASLMVPAGKLRIANDVIDQTTIYRRHNIGSGDLDFEDVSAQVWEAAEQQSSRVLDVRARIAAVHHFPDRRHAPPPMGILFVLETTDFAENAHLIVNARGSLGITAGTPAQFFREAGAPPLTYEGHLPNKLKSVLEELFGAPYHPDVLLGNPVNKNTPAWIRRERDQEE
ncbi:hypothetical protein [Rhodanobacter denitrificans]|uniref:hypothetical protein n=1 Tax=Rhodanobacter denitrificans TaxID=666685 RepID=UPI001F39938E|nr:hypothetical protein [Rhodanobacter denitrificans]UJJ60560.1 hypothetical protein LRK55_19190 [Rhodanobacter denitrificans]